MSIAPLVSVITPAIPARAGMLAHRCIPSVLDQWYPGDSIEHVVISDGYDQKARELCQGAYVQWSAVQATEGRHWGASARNHGQEIASGEYIAYLDDDDEFLPCHLMVLVSALIANPNAQWAYAGVNWQRGDGTRYTFAIPPEPGNVSSILMHRATLPARWEDGPREHWELVSGWLAQGIPYVAVNVPTAIAHQEGRS